MNQNTVEMIKKTSEVSASHKGNFYDEVYNNTVKFEESVWSNLVSIYNMRSDTSLEVNISLHIIEPKMLEYTREERRIAIKHNNTCSNDRILFYVSHGITNNALPIFFDKMVNDLKEDNISCDKVNNGSVYKFSIKTKDLKKTIDYVLSLKK